MDGNKGRDQSADPGAESEAQRAEISARIGALLKAENYADAIPLLRLAAGWGSANARMVLGRLCARDLGVPLDAQAVPWLRTAAEQDDKAALALARLLADAASPPGDLKEAAHWLEKLEPNHKGDTELLRQVCKELAEADPAECEAWLGKGAKYESHECMYLLAQCMLARDSEEALRWLRKAADLGHAASIGELARLYCEARRVPADPWSALFWLRAAASRRKEAPDQKTVERLLAQARPANLARLANARAVGEQQTLMASSGWIEESGGVLESRYGVVHASTPCCGQLVTGQVYRVTEPPLASRGLARDDLVAVCRGYADGMYVAEALYSAGRAHVVVHSEDHWLGDADLETFCSGLEALGTSLKMRPRRNPDDMSEEEILEMCEASPESRVPVVTCESHAALLPLIRYLDDWGWEIKWNYLHPSMAEFRAAYPDAPDEPHPLPPNFSWEWPEGLTEYRAHVPDSDEVWSCVATRARNNVCEIVLPPAFAIGISAGDRYEVNWKSRHKSQLAEKGPNRTIWMACPFACVKSQPLFRGLAEMGCVLTPRTEPLGEERSSDRNICVTLPGAVPLERVIAHMKACRGEGLAFKARLCDPGPGQEIV